MGERMDEQDNMDDEKDTMDDEQESLRHLAGS